MNDSDLWGPIRRLSLMAEIFDIFLQLKKKVKWTWFKVFQKFLEKIEFKFLKLFRIFRNLIWYFWEFYFDLIK